MEHLCFVGEQENVIGVCANTIERVRLDGKAVRIMFRQLRHKGGATFDIFLETKNLTHSPNVLLK